MRLVVGLGNPGRDYAHHRHNVGFMALDKLVQRHAPQAKWRQRFRGDTAEFSLEGKKFLALKPLTYMNESGVSAQAAASFYKIAPADIIVFHDDLDLEFARIEIKQGGGHAGHNGLKSLDSHLGKDYWRVRIGIGHPVPPGVSVPRDVKQQLVLNHVLSDFNKAEAAALERVLDDSIVTFPYSKG